MFCSPSCSIPNFRTEFKWTWSVLNPKGKSLGNTWAVVILVLGPELLLNCSSVLSPWNAAAFWFENTAFLMVWQCVLMGGALDMNPTGGGGKAPLPKIPAGFGAKHWISGIFYCCAWTASLLLLRGLMAIWIHVWSQYLGLKVSSHKYRHCWEMS